MVYNYDIFEAWIYIWKKGDAPSVPFLQTSDLKKILLRLLCSTSMVFIFALINTWGFRKQKWDAQLRPIFSTFNRQKKYYRGCWSWTPWFIIQPYLNAEVTQKKNGTTSSSRFFHLQLPKKILTRLLTLNSMVYNSTIFKCWGYPENNRDVLGVPFFQPSIDKKILPRLLTMNSMVYNSTIF